MQDCGAGLGAGPGAGAGAVGAGSAGGEAARGAGDDEGRDLGYGAPSGSNLAMHHKPYGSCSPKEISEGSLPQYCRVVSGHHDLPQHHYPNNRYNHTMPSFSSPPSCPLVGLVFDPAGPGAGASPSYGAHLAKEQQARNSWTLNNQEQILPIGSGITRKTDKNTNDKNIFGDSRSQRDEYLNKNMNDEKSMMQRRNEGTLASESVSSLDFLAESERMVSELCNISEHQGMKIDQNQKGSQKENIDNQGKPSEASEILLTALDKIVIHDQIPNQIVQLAIEACTDAENIAIAHHNRPCFKNIHSICAKTRSNVQKADSAVANLHSQGVPWVIKNFIFSFVRILDGWKGVKELLNEKHENFSRIENKYYSPHIRECFYQWQAITKEMLTHVYKTFKCLDHGFTMEQKSFTHHYYASNSTTPRHQSQKFQPKPTFQPQRSMNISSQPYSPGPSWMQAQNLQSIKETWPLRTPPNNKKFSTPLVNPNNYYPLSEQSEIDQYQKNQYKYEPATSMSREVKSRQSWTISSVPDFRSLETMSNMEQNELYAHLKSRLDSELGKSSFSAGNIGHEMHQRREKELIPKMIPLSHVEKTLIPNVSAETDLRPCYMHKNSYGDNKEKQDFLSTWGQMPSKDPQTSQQNLAAPYNVINPSGNIGPVQYMETESEEYHDLSKVYMKPGSYRVPIKPADMPNYTHQPPTEGVLVFDNPSTEEVKMKMPVPSVSLTPNPKYGIDSWPCIVSRRPNEVPFVEDPRLSARHSVPCIELRNMQQNLCDETTTDRAWEAAKQTAPKLMCFVHEGSKTDAARLYSALGLTAANVEFADDLKHQTECMETEEIWTVKPLPRAYAPQNATGIWTQVDKTVVSQEFVNQRLQQYTTSSEINFEGFEDQSTSKDASKSEDLSDTIDKSVHNQADIKTDVNDQSLHQNDNNQKKAAAKPKLTSSSMWYHPKKKKPIALAIVKKFERVLHNLSQVPESTFIHYDMDLKDAPRFYEVVKNPMCLNDISTKLKHSSYTEQDQVIHDFRKIFNNVRLYLKTCPDPVMKKNINKVSTEFEKLLSEELHKNEPKSGKAQGREGGERKSEVNPKDEINKTCDSESKSGKSDHKGRFKPRDRKASLGSNVRRLAESVEHQSESRRLPTTATATATSTDVLLVGRNLLQQVERAGCLAARCLHSAPHRHPVDSCAYNLLTHYSSIPHPIFYIGVQSLIRYSTATPWPKPSTSSTLPSVWEQPSTGCLCRRRGAGAHLQTRI